MAGRLVILSGPSGVGKDTVIDAWRLHNPLVERVVAATSRDPRQNEVDGVDYHFLTRDAFLEQVEQNGFLEFKEVFGKLYGTPLEGLERILSVGKLAVLKIDVQGALDVIPKRPDATTIFLLPPSEEELESRLRSRSTNDEEDIKRRLTTAHEEIAIGLSHYTHHVINANIDQTVRDLEAIVNG